ncbi:MAG: hypothetical protein Marn2KO_36220 [Marinobacter nauticus]
MAVFAFLVGVVWGGVHACRKCPDRYLLYVLLAVLILGAVVRLGFVAALPTLDAFAGHNSDFMKMWAAAKDWCSGGNHSLASIFEKRSFPVFTLSVCLFGASALTYKLTGAVMLTFAHAAVSGSVWMTLGARPAIITACLVAMLPGPLYALLVQSHDITTLFGLSIAIFGLTYLITRVKTIRSLKSNIVIRMLCGFVPLFAGLVIVAFSRDPLHLILVVAMGIAILYHCSVNRGLVARTAGAALIGVALTFMAVSAFHGALISKYSAPVEAQAGNTVEYGDMRALIFAAFLTPYSDGNLRDAITLRDTYLGGLSADQQKRFARDRFLSGVAADPTSLGTSYATRSQKLMQLAGSHHHYFARLEGQSLLGQDRGQVERYMIALDRVFAALLLTLGTIGLVRLLRSRQGLALLPLFFLALYVMALSIAGEVQPRYGYMAWFFLAVPASFAFPSLRIEQADTVSYQKAGLLRPLIWTGVLGFVGIYLIWLIIAHVVLPRGGEMVSRSDWQAGTGLDLSDLRRANQPGKKWPKGAEPFVTRFPVNTEQPIMAEVPWPIARDGIYKLQGMSRLVQGENIAEGQFCEVQLSLSFGTQDIVELDLSAPERPGTVFSSPDVQIGPQAQPLVLQITPVEGAKCSGAIVHLDYLRAHPANGNR